MKSLIVDLFAGAGGASEGIRSVLGRDPDVAINHNEAALAAHAANHPGTRHLRGNVWAYAPRDIVGTRSVGLLWASPTCTHFSRAKGAPLNRREATKVRALAWVVSRWAKDVRPRVICLENVEAFADWGPLLNDGRPCPMRKGFTFRRWVRSLEKEGYVVEWRELRACDYGAPTSRKRLFVVARCDGKPIVWPATTHGRGLTPHPSAAECIDWTIPVPSIFGRKKSLAEATLRRIARGVRRFVVENADPFIVPVSHSGDDRVHSIHEPVRTVTASSGSPFALVAPCLIHRSNGERIGQAPRVYDIEKPVGTIVASGVKHALVAAFLAKHYGGHEGPGQSLSLPLGTVTCRDHHALVTARSSGDRAEDVRAFLTRYNGGAIGQPAQLPLQTITTARRFGLVTVDGEDFEIRDIGMRMLTPRELARAQGFPDSYALDPIVKGKPLGPTGQIRLIGNSVPPALAAALVRANFAREEVVAA